MRRSPPPKRKTGLKRVAPPRRGRWPSKTPKSQAERAADGEDWSEEVKRAVRARAGGQCEIGLDGCWVRRALQFHHRKRRGHGDHSKENCILACAWCHQLAPRAIHSGFMVVVDGVTKLDAYQRGWLVRFYDEPAEVPWTGWRPDS